MHIHEKDSGQIVNKIQSDYMTGSRSRFIKY